MRLLAVLFNERSGVPSAGFAPGCAAGDTGLRTLPHAADHDQQGGERRLSGHECRPVAVVAGPETVTRPIEEQGDGSRPLAG